MKQNVRYAIFGGSFDPPHLGHKEIIKEALKLKEIDRVLVVPTFLNPFKNSFSASPEIRLKWTKESFKDIKEVMFSDFEIKNQRVVYSVETYKALSKEYNIKAFIIGADNLNSISKWKEFDYLNENLEWLVASRDNIELDCTKLKKCKVLPLNIDVSSSEIRAGQKLDLIEEKIKEQVILEYNLKKS